MSQAANKLDWCLKKAQKEGSEHRGLIIVAPDKKKAEDHIQKALHYLEVTEYLRKGGYVGDCASTLFYAIYQSLLAIGLRFGYESRNQECTFALMYVLAEEEKITLDKVLLEKIASLNPENKDTSVKLRERMQYGTEISMSKDAYEKMFGLAKRVLEQAKHTVVN
ncbi:MAG: HEPN domain-containing protein [Nanoarchaeota archaeon]|nr:HEPN domain-containing protein [Nanoarchaeota archaeon]